MQCDNIKDKIGAVLPNDALIFYESDMYMMAGILNF